MKKIKLIYLRSKISSDNRELQIQKELYEKELKKHFEISDEGETFFFIESGGTEEEFKQIFKSYSEPYNLIATDANNSLPASLEIASFLSNLGKRYNLYHGRVEDIYDVLSKKNDNLNVKNEVLKTDEKILSGKRFGIVGKPSDWLISSDVDAGKAEDVFGASLIEISFAEFKDEIDNAKEIIDPVVFKNKLNAKVNEETLKVALKIYSALYSLIKKHDLAGLTVRCFDLLGVYHNTSCLALALLNAQGYIATCEGDVPAMLTMAVVREKFHDSSFQVNPSYVDLENRTAYFAHCTLPLDMCLDYVFDTHFESGLGIGIKGRLNLGKVTVFKIGSTLEKFEVFSGQIVENLHKDNLCRTQIKVRFDEDISSLVSAPCGNHLIIFRGDHKSELLSILSKH